MDVVYSELLEAYKKGNFDEAIQNIDINTYATLANNGNDIHNDYVPYPGYNDPAFYKKIRSKKEFNDIANTKLSDVISYEEESSKRCASTAFTLAPYQIFVKRFLSPDTPYNSLLIYHGVGVGKTCSAISIAEQYIGLYKKKVLIVSSTNIQASFKKQIFDFTKYDIATHTANQCTGTKYPDMIIDRNTLSNEAFQKRIEKLIYSRYQFLGYKELVNIMVKIKEKIEKAELNPEKREQRYKDKIRELFSDRLFIIDEAHNLRMPSENGKKQISSAFTELLSIVTDVKLLLMTATPMFNDQREIIWLLKLMLTNDRRPLIKESDIFNKDGELKPEGKKRLEKICTGYISYMKGENPFSFPFRLYPKILGDKHLITEYPSIDFKGNDIDEDKRMKSIQLIGSKICYKQMAVYEKLMEVIQDIDDEEQEEIQDSEDIISSNGFQNVMQLCNIVYPSQNIKRTYGMTGFYDYFDKVNGNRGTKFEYKDTNNQILSYDMIGFYAPKIKRILEYIINSKGIVFVYSQYYYSGILPLAIALEHIGFNKHKGNITDKIKIEQKAPLLGNGRRPNYVILSRNRDLSSDNDAEIDIATSLQNKDGDLIKVIIVSKIGTEGIDFKYIREMHLLDPWYNMNRAEQIIGRGVRTCSHIALPKEHRNTSIYMHALTMKNKEQESVDMRVYRIAESKQHSISEVEDILKASSIDCEFNKHNIILPEKVQNMAFDIETSQGNVIRNFSLKDAYTNENYTCIRKDSKKSETDTSTYTETIISDEIDLYKKYIANLFLKTNKYSYKELLHALQSIYNLIDEDILKYTLQSMLDEKYMFQGLHNKKGLLIYANNKYIFVTDSYSNDIHHKPRLLFSSLAERSKYKIQTTPTKTPPPKTNSSQKSTQKSTQSNEISPTPNIIRYIENETQQRLQYIPAKLKEHVYDAVIDRLSTEQLIALLQEFKKGNLPPLIEKSVQNMSCIMFDSKDTSIIHGFYNHIEKEFYCFKNNTFVKCSALDSARLAEYIEKMRNILYDKPKTIGFIQHKKGIADFKIRDGNTSGYVCRNTPSLVVDELRKRIVAIDERYEAPTKLPKVKLCDIYEILLRKKGEFTRPFLAHGK